MQFKEQLFSSKICTIIRYKMSHNFYLPHAIFFIFFQQFFVCNTFIIKELVFTFNPSFIGY